MSDGNVRRRQNKKTNQSLILFLSKEWWLHSKGELQTIPPRKRGGKRRKATAPYLLRVGGRRLSGKGDDGLNRRGGRISVVSVHGGTISRASGGSIRGGVANQEVPRETEIVWGGGTACLRRGRLREPSTEAGIPRLLDEDLHKNRGVSRLADKEQTLASSLF